MRLTGEVKVNFRNKHVKDLGAGFVQDMALTLGEKIQAQAKHNVSPGVGPGPHPHNPGSHHIDTGNLRDSIEVDVDVVGAHAVAQVWSDLEYSVYLEYGWTARSGKFYRYPFLWPALDTVRPEVPPLMAQKGRVWFSGDSGPVGVAHGLGMGTW